GCLHLEVTVTGKQAHAAMPAAGVDALEAALARIRSATAGIISPTLNVGLIKGGINTNVVPDQVAFRIDRRVIPEEDPVEVEAELRALIANSAKHDPQIKVEVRRLLLAEPLAPRPAENLRLKDLRAATKVVAMAVGDLLIEE